MAITSGGAATVVAWRRIDPRYLRQEDPEGLALGYASHGELDRGHLLLYLDRERGVARFELVYRPFLTRSEHLAEWESRTGLRTGEIDAHDDAGDWGQRPRMSPIVRYRRPSPAVLGRLLGYVERNAGPLDFRHRQTIATVLRQALQRSATEASDSATDGWWESSQRTWQQSLRPGSMASTTTDRRALGSPQ